MYKILDIRKFVEDTDYREFPEIKLNAGFRIFDELKKQTMEFSLVFDGGQNWGESIRNMLTKEEEYRGK